MLPPNDEMQRTKPGQTGASPLISVFGVHLASGAHQHEDLDMAQRVVDVERLTPEEQLELLGELWDRLSKAPENVPLTQTQRAEIDRRSDDLDQDVQSGRPLGIPWDEVFRQVRTRV